MASVTDIITSGDNDEPLTPERRVVHYMYCDNCGSFALTDWLEPPDYERLIQLKGRATQVRNYAMIATLITAVLALFGLPLPLLISLLILAASAAFSSYIGRKIHLRGVVCQDCHITYVNGSSFYTEPENNPRRYTMADVPRPLVKVYQIKNGW